MYQNVVYRFLEAHHTHAYAGWGGDNMHNTVFPFVDSWSHHKTIADMLRAISFPEVRLNAGAVVLAEGDFTTAFGSKKTGHFDVVVTHFFIDTARNFMSYLDIIFRVLKPGGVTGLTLARYCTAMRRLCSCRWRRLSLWRRRWDSYFWMCPRGVVPCRFRGQRSAALRLRMVSTRGR